MSLQQDIKLKSASENLLLPRPPIVVVLGHVDHGKSSLLEAIREDFQITAKEPGGITQSIGAYVAEYQGKYITFLDTPGHEVFGAMRARGARVADIAILVVAADEGVQSQTKEAIEVIKKAGIPFIVAINKIDKPTADIEKVKISLTKEGVFLESMGGKIPWVKTSATKKEGIADLLEMIFLVAELEDLKADYQKPGEGVIIEAYIDSKRGPTATLLLRDGSLKIGDFVGTSSAVGKVKILEDFQGRPVEKGLPGMPVLMVGFENCPEVGEVFKAFLREEEAKLVLSPKEKRKRIQQIINVEPGKKVVNIILKADVRGSLEALEHLFLSLPQDNIILRIVESGIGEINENDVKLAQSTKAKIFGFRTKVSKTAGEFAKRENIKIETFDIIYELIQHIRQILEKSPEPEVIERKIGRLEVLAVFFTEKNRQIIGGKVLDGEVRKGATIEVIREDRVLGQGRVINLQKDKKDVPAVAKGEACGILYEGEVRIQEGDILSFSITEKLNNTLFH